MMQDIHYQITVDAKWDSQNGQYRDCKAMIVYDVKNLTVIQNVSHTSQAKHLINMLEYLLSRLRI